MVWLNLDVAPTSLLANFKFYSFVLVNFFLKLERLLWDISLLPPLWWDWLDLLLTSIIFFRIRSFYFYTASCLPIIFLSFTSLGVSLCSFMVAVKII